ncbi:MAG TPA: cyclic nucleotide-binding domain-containing protein [Gaiellales bacterium]|nr:cyclic nucleotide-binding domain-containing protein [Gaiellales bacterium]
MSTDAPVGESQILAALASVPLFAGLGKRELKKVAGAATVAHVPAGQHVVREGFTAEAFYVILEGEARATGTPVRSHLGAGDFCGEMGLLDGSTRSASILAETDVTAVKLPRKEFLDLVDRHAEIARGLLSDLAARVRRLEAALREADMRKPQSEAVNLDDSGGVR